MTQETPLADMVERMLAAGIAADVIVLAVATAELHGCASADQAAQDDPPQAVTSHVKTKTAHRNRGQRIATDWNLSESGIAYALDRGMMRDRIEIEAEKFKNYWTAKTGTGAMKHDWEATWRNWILTALERRNGTPTDNKNQWSRAHPAARSAQTGADAVLAGMGRVARRIVERRNAVGSRLGQVSDDADAVCELDLKPGGA
jgi:hypothetical protein